ncbi:cytochrome c [Pendulispora brunnea]|uniref:Cytochrome c n=1 Tax=Pendulispora brunnea TaxID=2905690 RepID=A0ABZ2KJD9_9BACT
MSNTPAIVLLACACLGLSALGCGKKDDGSGAPVRPDISAKDPLAKVPEDGTPGATLINQLGCGNCHNEGDSPLAGRMAVLGNLGYPPDIELFAPNLTPDPDTGLGNWTDGQLRLAIRNGIRWDSSNLCPQMDHYDYLTDEQLDAIIAYLRKLPPVKKTVPGSVCPPLKRKTG